MPNLADKTENWVRHNRRALVFALLLCAAYTLCIGWFRDYQFDIGRVLLESFLTLVPLVYAPRAFVRPRAWRLWPLCVFGSVAAFFIVAMRTALAQGGGVWRLWLVLPFALFAFTYTLWGAGLMVLLQRANLRRSAPCTAPRRLWPVLLAVLVALWLPTFATFGPVRISPDSYDVLSQALGVSGLDDSHPIAYTLLLRLFLWPARAAGSIMAGAYLLGFAQLCAMAATLSYSVAWLWRRGCPALVCLAAMAFFGFAPAFAINAVTLWKDIPFACLLLLLALRLADLAESGGAWLDDRKNALNFLVICIGVCFARGNGFILVAAVCALVALCWRARWRRWLTLFAPLLLCVALVRGPLYSALGIGRLGSVEAAAIPLQQVARVVAEDGPDALTAGQAGVIERFVPLRVMAENFEPASPDNTKKHPEFDSDAFSANLGPFMGVWAELLPGHAAQYVNGWLTQTLGYWKYDFNAHFAYLDSNGDFNGSFGIEYKDFVYGLTGLNLHQFVANRTALPPMGLMAHAVLFAGALLLANRRGRLALALAPPLLVWLGLMAGAPTYADFRYMLVFAMGLPVFCWLPLARPATE